MYFIIIIKGGLGKLNDFPEVIQGEDLGSNQVSYRSSCPETELSKRIGTGTLW